MKPANFTYHRPQTLDEALQILSSLDGEGRVLAGGQSLVPLLALRLSQPAHLVDINRIDELTRIEDAGDNGRVRIGAMVRQRAAERSAVICERVPLLAEALPQIAHPQVRNRGTIGGSAAHGDPAAEIPAVLAVLDATIVAAGPGGTRRIRAGDFFLGYLTTALEPAEILTAVEVPSARPGEGYAWMEFSRRHGDFAVVGVGAKVTSGGRARLAFTGVGGAPVVVECHSGAASEAAGSLEPPSDVHASGDYRRHLASVLAARAVARAQERIR